MARRLVRKPTQVGRCQVKIYKDPGTQEWIVQSLTVRAGRLRVEGGKDGGAFETSPSAARSTAAAEVRRLRKLPACRKQG